jgi:hypothetical protein
MGHGVLIYVIFYFFNVMASVLMFMLHVYSYHGFFFMFGFYMSLLWVEVPVTRSEHYEIMQ